MTYFYCRLIIKKKLRNKVGNYQKLPSFNYAVKRPDMQSTIKGTLSCNILVDILVVLCI